METPEAQLRAATYLKWFRASRRRSRYATNDLNCCSMSRTVPDSVPYEKRLAAAVDFVRQNLAQGRFRIQRAIRQFGVQAEDIERELELLGFQRARNGRSWTPPAASSMTVPRQSVSDSPAKTRKPAKTKLAYCPMCREEREIKIPEGRTWGRCSVCGSSVGTEYS